MTLFTSPCYWYMPDKLLVRESSPMDTRYGDEKNQRKNEMKDMKVLRHRWSLEVCFHSFLDEGKKSLGL